MSSNFASNSYSGHCITINRSSTNGSTRFPTGSMIEDWTQAFDCNNHSTKFLKIFIDCCCQMIQTKCTVAWKIRWTSGHLIYLLWCLRLQSRWDRAHRIFMHVINGLDNHYKMNKIGAQLPVRLQKEPSNIQLQKMPILKRWQLQSLNYKRRKIE